MKTYFYYRENPDSSYSICPMYKEFNEDWKIMGSWAVLPARLFGISWPDYLRYCIQNGAKVVGREHIYPIIKWDKPNKEFINELNHRANKLIGG